LRPLDPEVRAGLEATPKRLSPVWFYDERGSALFDDITRLPEYYPTRAERELLRGAAPEIAARLGPSTLVELGSGTSDKTRLLLDAFRVQGSLQRYVPLDVDGDTLAAASSALRAAYPGLVVDPVTGDFHHDLHRLPGGPDVVLAFLGGTIGNLVPHERRAFLESVAAVLDGGHLLLGADLVKDEGRLVAAYDDAASVTAAFNRNALRVVNRALDADFDVDAFDHVARWNPTEQWIEMRLRATSAQKVHVGALDLDVVFDEGEELLTEISAKFTPERLTAELAAAGLTEVQSWRAGVDDFLLVLATGA
jgi:L-histidine N-alpha-methyltransferase